MVTSQRSALPSSVIAVVGVCLVGLYVACLFILIDNVTWDTSAAMIVGPLLFLATLPALARQARREGDRRVFWFLVAALTAKMLFSLFRYYHAFYVVDRGDSRAYDRVGTEIANRFLDGNFDTGLSTLLDTNFIRFFTGVIYTVIRPSVVSGFLTYAWLAFIGTFFFYRAFVLAVPDGNRRSYGRWLFFLPSILFWPSSIGKESWMLFALGIAAFGAAKLLVDRALPGLFLSAIGIGLASLVRTPIAVILGLALLVGILLKRMSPRMRELAPIVKVGSILALAFIGLALAVALQRYVTRSGLGTSNFENLITQAEATTSQGGSEFSPTPATSPPGFVMASVTVLFRPFIFEANTAEAVVTSIEASALLVMSLIRFRSFVEAIRRVRRTPYIAVAIVYVVGSIVALSPVANFGIIARQRTLIYPMFLVLMCIPAPKRAKGRSRSRQETEAPSRLAAVSTRGGATAP